MTADKQNSTPNVLPIGELPTRRLGFGSMQLTGPGHWALRTIRNRPCKYPA
jgi:pyridoxine 4-dehydrogenase